MTPRSRRPLLLHLVFLLIVGISAVSIFAGNQFFKTKPHIQVGVTATIPVGSTIPGTVPPSIVATTPLSNLYPHPPGTFISDPLGHACQFRHGAYHISAGEQLGQLGQFNINSCYGGSSVSNFVYEIQMTIVKGDFGGIFFRYQLGANTSSLPRYYDFLVGSDATFQLIIPGEDDTFLAKGSSAFINKGPNVQNTLAVVASGSHIDLYVNKHIVAIVNDTSFSQGQIGITALGVNNKTDVTFTNQKIWNLPAFEARKTQKI
jgi:hypothetical protein